MCFGWMVAEGESMHMAICYDLVYLIDLGRKIILKEDVL